jgi:AcrR family transcriptional regulator
MDEQSRRHRMTAGSRREQILDVTHAIVDTESFHAATLGRIATEAGITRTVLYQQFGDLPGLFVALVDREAERAAAQFASAVAASGDPDEGDGTFSEAFAGFLHAVDAHPATWRLFLFPPQGAPPELHERLAHAEAVARQYIADVLLEINPRISDPEYTARILHVAGRELLRLRLTEPEAASHDRLLAHVRRLTPALLRQAPRG